MQLVATASAAGLEIVCDPNDGNFQFTAAYAVRERDDDLTPAISLALRSTDVFIEGQTIAAPEDFTRAQSACIRAQTADITVDGNGLKELMTEFAEFVATHHGPPIDQALIGDIRKQTLELADQLRLSAEALATIARVRRRAGPG